MKAGHQAMTVAINNYFLQINNLSTVLLSSGVQCSLNKATIFRKIKEE